MANNSFLENGFYDPNKRLGMDPPKTKKQSIKNQKEKGKSEHRLGSAKHVRLAEQRKRTT